MNEQRGRGWFAVQAAIASGLLVSPAISRTSFPLAARLAGVALAIRRGRPPVQALGLLFVVAGFVYYDMRTRVEYRSRVRGRLVPGVY